LAEFFRDRTRAESFGALADVYDRLRPAAPEALLDDLAALAPERVLDAGCGTGKVARGLIERGLDVLGVELDERMAAIARSHGVPVEIAAFEDWDPAGRTFDLITFGDCWHWLDPERAWRQVARLLRPGGTVVRFWNHHADDVKELAEAVYARCAPEVLTAPVPRPERQADDPRTENSIYLWERVLSLDDWIELVSTYSSHRALSPERLAALQAELRAALPGTVTMRYTTTVSRSRAALR
jgi:SAM-dependent methyltransferase